jgi:voltage-gated potassium channel
MKNKIHDLLNKNPLFIKFIYGLIILNVITLILESYKDLKVSFSDFFYYFEFFSIIVFSIEYLLRLWTSDIEKSINDNSFQKRLKFGLSTFGLIDLVAILPFYLPSIFFFRSKNYTNIKAFEIAKNI